VAKTALEWFVNGMTVLIAVVLIALALVGLVFELIKLVLIDVVDFVAEHVEDFE